MAVVVIGNFLNIVKVCVVLVVAEISLEIFRVFYDPFLVEEILILFLEQSNLKGKTVIKAIGI
jgi:hypothetical protein